MLRGFPSFWVPEARYERRWDLHASWIGSWPCQPDTGGQDAWSASVRVQTRDWKRFQDNRMSWSLAILTKSGPALRWHGQCRLDQVLFKTSNQVKCEFRKHLGFDEEDTVIFRYSRKMTILRMSLFGPSAPAFWALCSQVHWLPQADTRTGTQVASEPLSSSVGGTYECCSYEYDSQDQSVS